MGKKNKWSYLEGILKILGGLTVFYIYSFSFFDLISNNLALTSIGAVIIFTYIKLVYLKERENKIEIKSTILISGIAIALSIITIYILRIVAANQLRIYYKYLPEFNINTFIAMFVLVPILEELFFRQYAYKKLDGLINNRSRTLLISIFYAIATPHIFMQLPRFIIGIALIELRRINNKLLPSIILNGLTVFLLMNIVNLDSFRDNSKYIDRKKAAKVENIREERRIRLTYISSDEVYGEQLDVLYDDGLVYIDKKLFDSYLGKISSIDMDNKSRMVSGDGVVAKLNFHEGKSYIEEKHTEELWKARLKGNIEAASIAKSYWKLKDALAQGRSVELNHRDDELYLLNEYITALGYDFIQKDLTSLEYIMTTMPYSNRGGDYTATLNRDSYDELLILVENMTKEGLIDKEAYEYMTQSKNQVLTEFKYRGALVALLGNSYNLRNIPKEGIEDIAVRNKYFYKVEELGNVNYIKLKDFSNNQLDKLYEIFSGLDRDKGLIIDLRGTKEGSDLNSLYLLSLLVDKDINIYLKDTLKEVSLELEDMSKLSYEGDIVILTNEETSGVASIMASIARDNKIARIIGEEANGRSKIQKELLLKNGQLFMYSIDREYTDKYGESIDGKVEVDYEVEDKVEGGSDLILTKAIDYLKKR